MQISADDSLASQSGAVQLRATTQFYGTIYAPDANVTVGGAFELFGSVAARVLNLEPGARLHYDGTGNTHMPTLVSWQIVEVPPAVRAGMGDIAYGQGVDRDQLVPLSRWT